MRLRPNSDDKATDATVFVLYHGASWCQPCHQFSPSLVKFVNDAAPKNPKLFVVMISADEKDADVMKYATEGQMPWPPLPKSKADKLPYLRGLFGNYIPQVVVLDRYGKILANGENNGHVDNASALRALSQILGSGAAKG